MKKSLTLLVDMDDTIENLLESWLHILNKNYGFFVTPDMVTSWNIPEFYPGLNEKAVYAPLFTDELWRDIKPRWDAVKYLKMLHDDGHDIYIVTSSNFRTIGTKVESILHSYFPFIRDDHVIVAAKKQMIRGDVMIDDAPHNLEGGEYDKVLVTAPHNRTYHAEEHGMRRVDNWAQVYSWITELAELEEKCNG